VDLVIKKTSISTNQDLGSWRSNHSTLSPDRLASPGLSQKNMFESTSPESPKSAEEPTKSVTAAAKPMNLASSTAGLVIAISLAVCIL